LPGSPQSIELQLKKTTYRASATVEQQGDSQVDTQAQLPQS